VWLRLAQAAGSGHVGWRRATSDESFSWTYDAVLAPSLFGPVSAAVTQQLNVDVYS
jgi:hypothetical protein